MHSEEKKEPAGEWSTVTVAGHPCHVYEPPAPSEHGYVLIYLHGLYLDKLSERPAFGHEFDRHGLRVIAPETKRSWWSDRICEEFDPLITAERFVLDQVLPYIAQRWGTRPPAIGLFGVSMGGQGALRLAYKHPDTFPVVVGLAPSIDFQRRMREGVDDTLPLMYRDEEEARQDTATLHVHPLNWPRNQLICCDPTDERWWESADRLAMKLRSLGVPHESDLETIAGGHSSAYYEYMAPRVVSFMAERLEQERLRLPLA